jgi:hypothetical protein
MYEGGRMMVNLSVAEFFPALRDFWSLTNKQEYLDLLFSGWDEEDPNEYYHNKWIVFRASPIQAWCGLDDDKQFILTETIAQKIQSRREKYGLPL